MFHKVSCLKEWIKKIVIIAAGTTSAGATDAMIKFNTTNTADIMKNVLSSISPPLGCLFIF